MHEPTALGGVDDDNPAERPVSLVVVHADLHFKRGERREGLVSVFVRRGVRRRHHLLLPASGSVGAEGDDVPKALAVLELFGHGLKYGGKREEPITSEIKSDCGGSSSVQLSGSGWITFSFK